MEYPVSRLHNTIEWAKAIRAVDPHSSLISPLEMTKADYAEVFDSLNLPTYSRHITTLSDFLETQDVRHGNQKTEKLWIQLMPNVPSRPKITELDIEEDKIVEKVQDLIEQHDLNPLEYDILISEFMKNEYGGQMIVSPNGEDVAVFFGEGAEQDFSSGSKTPEYMARTTLTGVIRYSFEDSTLRETIWSLIKATSCPSDDGRFDRRFHPGYYEFALCEDNGKLKPIFLDYRPDDIYQLPDMDRLGMMHR